MHDYSIDRHPKEKVIFFLSVTAVTITPLVNAVIKSICDKLGLIGELAATTIPVSLFFAFIYWLFDEKLWKVALCRRFMLVPDLNGDWSCDGKQFLKQGKQVELFWKAEIKVIQSWSKIIVNLKTAQSQSRSVTASIRREPGSGYRLVFVYENSPNADERALHRHTGTCELIFDQKCLGADGFYFTDHDRNTVGTMKLVKKEVGK